MMKRSAILAFAVATGVASLGLAVPYPEIEPNNSKADALANPAVVLGFPHTSIVGNTTGTSTVAGPTSLDQFLVQMVPQPFGIYRNQLVITSNIAGHTGTIRSIPQVASAPDTLPGIPWDGVIGTPGLTTTDNAGQTSSATSTPPRFNQWYSFGQSTQFYYRVTGTTSTTADYTATWNQVPVVPTNLGTFQPGLITMNWNGQGHTTDTDIWVYDSNLNPIVGYGNDDSSLALGGAPIASTSLQSWLARNYAPGVYYLAVTNFGLLNDQPSPSDDNFRTGGILEFPGMVMNSSTTINLNLSFTIDDGTTPLVVSALKTEAYEILWYSFTVVPEPTSLGLCLLALPLALRRRRA
jgi:hypothetical protein